MKHVLLLITAIALSAFSMKAQSIQEINRTVTNDRAGVNTLRDNLNSRGGGTASCGPDTLIYSLAKATALQIVNINNATSVFAVSQYYDAPQDITVNGASFYAFKADATGGIATDVAVSVYVAGPDSLPTGAPLTTGLVSVDTTFGTGALTTLVKHANFNPVTVSQPYCVVVENDSPNGIGVVTSDYTVADGQGEWLGSGNLFGTWLHGYDLVLGPDQFDADILIEPHVEYQLEASFTQSGVCIQENGGDGTWVNNSSPMLGNRMYSLAAFLGQTEAQFSWNYGDGSPIENITDGAHTYTGTSPWTVTLTDTLFGWSVICVDDFIENAETVEAGTLTAVASPVCLSGGSADISATEGDAPVVPAGYEVLYVLTDADNNLTVLNAAATPDFTVNGAGNYIIHTLVYDPTTLDPTTAIGLEAGVVNGLLVQGGGAICAALDLAGAPVSVGGPEAGTLTAVASPVCVGGTMEATPGDAPVVPTGYEVLYVLTDADNNLTVLNAAVTPEFAADSAGNFIIHTLVYDPNTLDPTTAIGLEAGVVNGLLVQGGGAICAALDLAGAPIAVEGPEAGTLTAVASPVCVGGTMEAVTGDAPVVPAGYEVLYVLTDADNNLTVLNASATPEFSADSAGNFIIHTLVYDPIVLDPAIAIGLEAGVVNGLLVQGGGAICAALDLAGAPVSVEGPEAGTLTAVASPVCLSGGSADISATEGDAPVVPAGYEVLYVLTDADNNLTVLNAAATPDFTVNGAGNYIIHTLVYDPTTLDPTTAIGLEAGVVNGLLVQGGGAICAALDLAGASITVEGPEAGTLTAVASPVCLSSGSADISATEGDAPVVPTGYEVLYVLTDADNNLTVLNAAATPDFTVNGSGNYIIHTLVYDPTTLDPTTAIGLEAGVVNGLLVQGGGAICAALDLAGATISVEGPEAGTLTAVASPVCLSGGSADISATEGDAPVVPAGYEVLYVLTDADNNLTVLNAAATPDFTVNGAGNYIIHTLVYNPNTLDPTTAIGLEAGVVNGLLVQGGGSICAALDLAGAPITVEGPEAGTLTADVNPVCLFNISAVISATEGDAPVVPTGYEVLYVLTDADNNLTVLDAAATPEFTVNSIGNYIIHTLVYDPNTLDPTTAIGLEAGVVNGLLVQGGGGICAALDIVGAPVLVESCSCDAEAGTLIPDAAEFCIGGTMSATEGDAPVVPTGYEVLYVLTDADNNLTVLNAAATPEFAADSAGNFIIHTLVYDPLTLDPTTAVGLEAGVVNGLLVQGGGAICAALDLAGAPVSVGGPEAGTLIAVASPVCVGGTMEATLGDAPVVPTGYEVLYVLTDADNNLTVLNAAATPEFAADSAGNFIIHTLVYDPTTLDPTTAIGLEAGVVNGLLVQGGGAICAALDLAGAPIAVEGPEAGTLTPDAAEFCIGGTMSATEGDAPVVPTGYEVLYVLTDADNNLTVLNAAATPEFAADSAGNFIIHTLVYDPNTLDPTTAVGLEAGVVNGLLVQGGGAICAALDLAGAPVSVGGPEAGTLTAVASPVCVGGTMEATPGDAPVVPTGYEVLYVLTDADNNLTVLNAAVTPEFAADSAGNFIIHTLVYDPNTLDPTTAIGLEAGVVNGLLVQGGGAICAALDLAGAPIAVEGPEAGTLTAVASPVCVGGTMEAVTGDAPVVPAGYEVLYVLTDADNNLTVLNASATPEFSADSAGNFIIHTLVYDPIVLDPAIAIGLEAGVVNGLLVQGGGAICAALDLAGAPVSVEGPEAGTLTAVASPVCLSGGSADISATEGDAPVVPAGYEVLYVLTDADNNLTVLNAAATPDFTVNGAGNYIIHTLVYDPTTLDPTTAIGLEAGVVNGLLVQGGGAICAALDLAGASITVEGPEAGTLTADASPVCVGGTMSATEGDAPVVPAGYEVLYVLTDADNNLTVLNAAATPEFSADSAGNFIIHTLVYDPNVLDPTIAIGLEAGVVNGLLVQGGGAICAALDLAGAPVSVEVCPCDAEAGTLVADATPVCLAQGAASISATEADAPVVPAGFEVLYVLTDADNNLTVLDAAATPDFTVNAEGNYIIHTLVYDPLTLDPTIAIGLEAGVVNGLLVQGGGTICAALDLVGAPITVEVCPCDADAGTLTANASTVCLANGEAAISATVSTNSVVPAGYETIYVLTQGTGLVIVDAQPIPEFVVTAGGDYTIHTLVYDPNTLDLGIVQFGTTTGFDVNGLLIQGGGSICASLDVAGATISVVGPNAGALVADAAVVCLDGGSADISASQVIAPEVPAGYAVFYVLTDADNNLTVLNGSINPEFTVSGAGNYIIHTLVYDPLTLDPANAIGLPAADVNALLVQGGGSICAALDLTGAAILVEGPEAGSLTADASPICLDEQGSATISATENFAPEVPAGYLVLYVLTDADNNLEILDATTSPEFTVTAEGNYVIHTLVYDPNTLTPTTAIGLPALDVNALLVQGGGSICAALDLTGAPIAVANCTSVRELAEESLAVYPNPSNGEFVIELAGVESEDTQILVFDMSGRQVYVDMVSVSNDFRKELNLDVAKGTYLLQIITADGVISRKLQFN